METAEVALNPTGRHLWGKGMSMRFTTQRDATTIRDASLQDATFSVTVKRLRR